MNNFVALCEFPGHWRYTDHLISDHYQNMLEEKFIYTLRGEDFHNANKIIGHNIHVMLFASYEDGIARFTGNFLVDGEIKRMGINVVSC